MTGFKAISFDGDGTLWDFNKVMRHSLAHVLKELNEIEPDTAPLLDIDKMISIRNGVASKLKGTVTNLEMIRLEAFRETLLDIDRPNDELACYLNQIYLKHRFEDIELFQDVMPALECLKTNFTLGLISNGNSYPERCGLEEMFQFVIFSQDHGVEKPDPKLFEVAIEKAGCSKHEFLHVGDSLQDDIVGAKNAGVASVWLNRSHIDKNMAVVPDHEISLLSELVTLL
jgi:putative hydrolase of the HAD superfamily